MQKEEIKRKDSSVMEGMQSIRSVIAGNQAGVNDRKIEEILVDREKVKAVARELGWLKRLSAEMGFTNFIISFRFNKFNPRSNYCFF